MNVEEETVTGATEADNSCARWQSTIAIVWLFGFLVFFYCLTPPNNPTYRRFQFWPEVPFVLLDAIDPPTEVAASSSGWSYFPQRFDLMLTAAIILAGAWGVGSLCLRLLRIRLKDRTAESTVFAFALGLAALSLLTLFCGLAGWLHAKLFAGVIVGTISVEAVFRLLDWRRKRQVQLDKVSALTANTPLSTRAINIALKAIPLLPFLLAMLLGAMLPSTDFDVREYHLQGPKEQYQAGQISFLPHNVYTSFPFFTEMLSLLAMVLRGDWFRGALAGKAVLMCFGPLTGLALYAAGRRWFSPKAGYIAALVYLTMPWTFRISTIAYAEGGLTFFLFATLLAFGIAIEKLRNEPTTAGRTFFLCGLLAGCAMACKYTGIVSVVIPLFAATCIAPFVLKLPKDERRRIALRTGAVFLLGTAVTIGPWLVKNVVETGNPVYPLMYTLFGGRDWDAQLNAKWRAGHSPTNYSDLPERILEVVAGNDWLTPLLFGLAPLSLFLWKRQRTVRYLWLYVLWLFATWWVLTHRIDRFWVPMTPVIALLAGIGAAAVRDRAWTIALRIGILAAVLFNLALVVSGFAGNDSFLIDLKQAQQTPPGIEYLNRTLPPGSRVLMVGEAQVFDSEFPLIYNTVFDRSIFEKWCAADQPSVPSEKLPLRADAAIRWKLRDEKVTHIFVSWQEILRYRTTYGYTKFVIPERFAELRQQGVLSAPITLAVLLDNDLAKPVNGRPRKFQPFQLNAPNGEQILVFGVRKEFTGDACEQLEQWGTKLLPTIDGKRLFVAGQIFEIARVPK